MKKQMLVIWTAIIVVLFCVGGIAAQDAMKMAGDAKMMAEMKKSPHHKLMMAYTKTMADFSRMLRDQALTPNGPDVEFARAAVAELRHNLDAMEALHQKHMAGMSAEMKEKMKMMMEKMDKDRAMVKDHVAALETAVRADKPDAKQVAMHANDLVKHFAMMKMTGKKKMKMKM
jgi:hypothetical protein